MNNISKEDIPELNSKFIGRKPEDVLDFFFNIYGDKVALASSLSIEDQVITDIMFKKLQISDYNFTPKVFTLDTGRLFQETYELIERTNERYGIKIKMYFPDFTEVENMVCSYGPDLFYDSLEKRHLCCKIRKLHPLARAFGDIEAWICGLRREQSVTRKEMQLIEWDESHNKLKINPLIDWDENRAWEYIKANNVPYNKLYEKGYTSIGCAPCTRAIKKGEDTRAGRWWWESPDHRECGLHVKNEQYK